MIRVHTKLNVCGGWMWGYEESRLLGVWRFCLLPCLSTLGNRKSIFKVLKFVCPISLIETLEFWSIKRQTSKERKGFLKHCLLMFLLWARSGNNFQIFTWDLTFFRHQNTYKVVLSQRLRLSTTLLLLLNCSCFWLRCSNGAMSVTVLHTPWRTFVSVLKIKACAIKGRTYSVEILGLWVHSCLRWFREKWL